MASIDVLFYLGGAFLTAAALWSVATLDNEVESFSERLRRDAASLKELQHRREAYLRLRSAQRFTESVFDSSAMNLRRMHMAVAGIPFEFLESIPAICKTAKIVRETHNLVAESAYRSILGINRAGGRLARQAIEQRWGRVDSNPGSRWDK